MAAIFKDTRQLNVPKSYFSRNVMYLTDFNDLHEGITLHAFWDPIFSFLQLTYGKSKMAAIFQDG